MKENMISRDLFFSNEIEIQVLGCILQDNNLFYKVNDYDNDVFYTTCNVRIFEIFKKLMKLYKKLDVITVSNYIVKNSIKEIDITYITNIALSVETLSNFETYLEILIELYQKRSLDKIFKKLDFKEDAEKLQSQVLKGLSKLSSIKENDVSTKEYLFSYYDSLADKTDKSIKTCFSKLDRKFKGFNPGELITIAAYSGIGKTTLALDIMLRQINKGYKVSLFTLEIPREQVLNKMMSNLINIEYSRVLNKDLNDSEMEKIAGAINNLSCKSFDIYEKKSSLEYIVNQIRRDKINKNIDIAYIDLINRVTTKERTSSRTEAIGYMTRTLKLLALELEIPIIITAQINREGEKRIDKRPLLADIKESGSISEDSDTVIGLYRNREMEKSEYREKLNREGKLNYSSYDPDYNPERIELSILKGRYCGNATFSMKWLPQYQKISEVLS